MEDRVEVLIRNNYNNNNKNPVTWSTDLVPSLFIERSEVQANHNLCCK